MDICRFGNLKLFSYNHSGQLFAENINISTDQLIIRGIVTPPAGVGLQVDFTNHLPTGQTVI
jgi:hypothetical protein